MKVSSPSDVGDIWNSALEIKVPLGSYQDSPLSRAAAVRMFISILSSYWHNRVSLSDDPTSSRMTKVHAQLANDTFNTRYKNTYFTSQTSAKEQFLQDRICPSWLRLSAPTDALDGDVEAPSTSSEDVDMEDRASSRKGRGTHDADADASVGHAEVFKESSTWRLLLSNQTHLFDYAAREVLFTLELALDHMVFPNNDGDADTVRNTRNIVGTHLLMDYTETIVRWATGPDNSGYFLKECFRHDF